MKKLLLLLLCVPLIYSCGENEKEKDATELTTNFNGIIEEYEHIYLLRNTSKNKKYEFTVKIDGGLYSNGVAQPPITHVYFLSPGEQAQLGSSSNWTQKNKEGYLKIRDGEDITYTITGEFEVK